MNLLKNKIDFIFLIEHPKRELDYVERVAFSLKSKGYSVKIISIHFHFIDVYFHSNSVILMPYCLNQSDFPFSAIPKNYNYTFININWEQILGAIQKTTKIINENARNVIQLYWNDDFKNFLKSKSNITERNLVRSVNPASYVLSNPKINIEFLEYLKKLNISKYCFLPVNYNWAMMSDERIKSRMKLGYSKSDADTYINYSKNHQLKFFNFIEELLKNNKTVVFRPHPGITINEYNKKIFNTNKFIYNHSNFFVDDSFTAFDWINHADYIISNWSTLIYDAHFSGKKAAFFWPEDIPSLIDSFANEAPPKIKTVKELYSISKAIESKTNEEFNSFIENLIMIKKNNFNQNLFSSIRILDYLKILRTIYYSLAFKFGLKFLIKKRILLDHFNKRTY